MSYVAESDTRRKDGPRMNDDREFLAWFAGELAELPAVEAVALGGSRAMGQHRPDSDWDFAIYYRARFEPDDLRAMGWDGMVSEVGGWGGGVMNGGGWLHIEGRPVDVHYRDLTEVEHWCAEAEHGRFNKELLLFYVAGIPTYVVMAELALNQVLVGSLPRPSYPDALANEAARRWKADAIASLSYGQSALRSHGDVVVALANASRALVEASHGLLAEAKQWVLNEKGIVRWAGLDEEAALLLEASDLTELALTMDRIQSRFIA
jgi:predicted nucleotidyltransferase